MCSWGLPPATWLMRLRTGLAATVLIGIAGALLGGAILQLLLTAIGLVGGFLGAVIGAVVLIMIWRAFQRRG